jgi:hypothetical protein
LNVKELFKHVIAVSSSFLTLLDILLRYLQKLALALGYREVISDHRSKPYAEVVEPGDVTHPISALQDVIDHREGAIVYALIHKTETLGKRDFTNDIYIN